jgi:hypothetical protein
MPDTQDDDIDPTPDRYVLTATVIDNVVRLTGPDLKGDTIEVPTGSDAIVKIKDAAGFYLYGAEIVPGGAKAGCWGRGAKNNLARRKFTNVTSERSNLVYAVSTRTTAEAKYGPVIKIKPVG